MHPQPPNTKRSFCIEVLFFCSPQYGSGAENVDKAQADCKIRGVGILAGRSSRVQLIGKSLRCTCLYAPTIYAVALESWLYAGILNTLQEQHHGFLLDVILILGWNLWQRLSWFFIWSHPYGTELYEQRLDHPRISNDHHITSLCCCEEFQAPKKWLSTNTNLGNLKWRWRRWNAVTHSWNVWLIDCPARWSLCHFLLYGFLWFLHAIK